MTVDTESADPVREGRGVGLAGLPVAPGHHDLPRAAGLTPACVWRTVHRSVHRSVRRSRNAHPRRGSPRPR
ncbi:hypothetical protein BGM09_15330 [Streptomyces sp. CBMA29]|nr:hypothetical protein [Streptomyces sp. CBMA29]